MADPLFSTDSSGENTNPSIAVNFVRNLSFATDINQNKFNYTTITLELTMQNFEPMQALNFFNSSGQFLNDCVSKVTTMYATDDTPKPNIKSNPEVTISFVRASKPGVAAVGSVTPEEAGLMYRYFLANIHTKIFDCEILLIQSALSKVINSITTQITEAVNLYLNGG